MVLYSGKSCTQLDYHTTHIPQNRDMWQQFIEYAGAMHVFRPPYLLKHHVLEGVLLIPSNMPTKKIVKSRVTKSKQKKNDRLGVSSATKWCGQNLAKMGEISILGLTLMQWRNSSRQRAIEASFDATCLFCYDTWAFISQAYARSCNMPSHKFSHM